MKKFQVLHGVSICLLGLITGLYLITIFDFIINFEEYRFGTEVAGYMYNSAWHYGIINGGMAAIGMCSLFLPLIVKVKAILVFRISMLCLLIVSFLVL